MGQRRDLAALRRSESQLCISGVARGRTANEGWRRDLNTSSIAGQQASPVLAAYAAAKAGVISYTKSLALQLGPAGIRVNAVAPGLIYTKVWEDLGAALGGGDANARATFDSVVRQLVPLGREQTQADIGRTVAWLCSDKAINVTGQVIAVDGGITLGQARIGEG